MNNLPEITTRPANCETHGPFESRHFFGKQWSRCPECQRILKEEDDRKQAEEEAKKRLEQYQRRIEGSGIPPRFYDRTFENFVADTPEKQRALKTCREFSEQFKDNKGKSLVLIGKPGTGKTHLAASIGVHVLKTYYQTVLFTTVQRAMRRVKDSWSKNTQETEGEVIDSLVSPSLLILDEVGVQKGSDFEKTVLFDVINERYENRAPIILLSNLQKNEVIEFLGDRVYDRLKEDGGIVVPFTWESHRGRKE